MEAIYGKKVKLSMFLGILIVTLIVYSCFTPIYNKTLENTNLKLRNASKNFEFQNRTIHVSKNIVQGQSVYFSIPKTLFL